MNRFVRASSSFLFVLGLLIAPMARAADKPGTDKAGQVNLLRLPNVKLEETTASAGERASLRALTDDNPATIAQFTMEKGSTVDIVYGFGGDIVTVERLVIQLPAKMPSGASTARVEILVSTLSAQAGFHSVRGDALKPAGQSQEFSFPPTAAGWILLRFTAGENATRLAVAETAVLGRKGPPVTHYAFKESPAKAIDVLAKLKSSSSVNVAITEIRLPARQGLSGRQSSYADLDSRPARIRSIGYFKKRFRMGAFHGWPGRGFAQVPRRQGQTNPRV